MAELQWTQIVIGIACGGLGGAILTAIITAYRTRVQPITYQVKHFQIFKKETTPGSLDAFLTLSDGTEFQHFENLFVATVSIQNTGNQDISDFRFELTLFEGEKAVFIEAISNDRSHKANILTELSIANPVSEIDIQLEPFNRGDRYSFNIHISVPSPGWQRPIGVTTRYPCNLKEKSDGELVLTTSGTMLAIIARVMSGHS